MGHAAGAVNRRRDEHALVVRRNLALILVILPVGDGVPVVQGALTVLLVLIELGREFAIELA